MYYLCAYGNSTRISEKVSTPEAAARYCYGVVSRVTCLPLPRSWKYLNQKEKAGLHTELAKLHLEQTGNQL
jgi:hypothetical protein